MVLFLYTHSMGGFFKKYFRGSIVPVSQPEELNLAHKRPSQSCCKNVKTHSSHCLAELKVVRNVAEVSCKRC